MAGFRHEALFYDGDAQYVAGTVPRLRETVQADGAALAAVADDKATLMGVGEPVWPGRGRAELIECERHESLLNLAFDSGGPWLLLCPYDVRRLDDGVLEAARRTHPQVIEAGVGRDRGRRAGLAGRRLGDLVLAVNELAANSMRHGGGHGTLLLWREEDRLVCEVRDDGRMDDPLAGRYAPHPGRGDGRGMWLVHQLCDLVQVRTPAAGTVIRVHMTL